MGSSVDAQVPFIDLKDLEEGSDEWNSLCRKLVEACEEYGCFQVSYDKVSGQLREDMFKAMEELFDLPVETKAKNFTPKPHFGYVRPTPQAPLYENLGISDVPLLRDARAFTDLMWSAGNPFVCETFSNMSKNLLDLEQTLVKMVLEGYGLGKYYESNVEISKTIFRLMKYKAPPPDKDSAMVGLVPHADKGILTILSEHEVQGLEVLNKQGQWIPVIPRKGTFTVVVGEAFMAWSNGRLHPVKHRVMMTGNKDRYTYALFVTPKEGAIVEVSPEMVDEDHPLRFRPFNYMDYIDFFFTKYTENALEVYAGV